MKRFDFQSLAAFADACTALPASATREMREQIGSWSGTWAGERYSESLNRCAYGGSAALVADAQALIDRIQANLPETPTRRWALEHVGAFPCVPAFLSGEPESMWALADTPTDTAPVRVYVSVCCSAGIPWQHMQRRGAAILALVLIASRSRPVELYAYSDWSETDHHRGDTVLHVRLPSHPMMLSEVAWGLTSPALMRNLGFAYLAHMVPTIPSCFPWGEATIADGHRGGPAQRNLLGLQPQDVLIGPTYLTDPCATDPIGFVNRELSKLGLTGE